MMLAMNRLGYDAMAVGNHEYNFGLKNLNAGPRYGEVSVALREYRRRRAALRALHREDGRRREGRGDRDHDAGRVRTWEKPENLGTYRFASPIDAVRKKRSRNCARTSIPTSSWSPRIPASGPRNRDENVVEELAAASPGDRRHRVRPHPSRTGGARRSASVLVVQPKNWGISLARLDFTLERQGSERWTVDGEEKPPDPGHRPRPQPRRTFSRSREPYHELAERYLNTPGGDIAAEQIRRARPRRRHRRWSTPSSRCSSFTPRRTSRSRRSSTRPCAMPKGQVTVRQIAALYPYDNELYAIEGDGQNGEGRAGKRRALLSFLLRARAAANRR